MTLTDLIDVIDTEYRERGQGNPPRFLLLTDEDYDQLRGDVIQVMRDADKVMGASWFSLHTDHGSFFITTVANTRRIVHDTP